MPRRRIDLVVGISYDADMRTAIKILEKLIQADERILKDPASTVAVSELGDSSVNLICRPWVATADYWPTRWKMIEDIKTEFDAAGVGIHYPQMDGTFTSKTKRLTTDRERLRSLSVSPSQHFISWSRS